jgi:hypothetical protein
MGSCYIRVQLLSKTVSSGHLTKTGNVNKFSVSRHTVTAPTMVQNESFVYKYIRHTNIEQKCLH